MYSKMKYYMQVLVLLVLAANAIGRVTSSNKFEKGLLKVIEQCVTGDVNSQAFAFPSLKTIKVPYLKTKHDGYTMSLQDIKIKGLENLTVRKLKASPSDLTLSLEIFIPKVVVQADRYYLQGQVSFFYNINDKGEFKSNFHNVKAQAYVQFGANGANTVLTYLYLDYSVHNVQVHLSGSNFFVNSGAKDRISNLIKDSEMKERIQNLIMKKAREYLRGYTPQEFVERISAL